MNPNSVTYISVLKACGIVKSLETGGFIDAEIRKRGLFKKDIVLGNALMDMYCKCGALDKPNEVFEKLLVRDVVSWNVLIIGYVQHRLGDEALKCFKQMKDESVYPNVVTYIGVLRACGIMKICRGRGRYRRGNQKASVITERHCDWQHIDGHVF